MHKDSKIYVAGHKGLVGSALVKMLNKNGYKNIIRRTHEELDLLDALATKAFFEEEKPEYVFLAAAFVGGIMSNSIYRADFIYKNIQIQQNVIGESFRNDVKKLLFLGSTCVYPREAPQPIKEDALLTSPLEYTNEPYAIAKIAGLKMCESFNLQYGTNYISVMPANLYGPNDNFDLEKSHVLPAMIRKIHLAHCLKNGKWDEIYNDIKVREIVGINEQSTRDDVISKLASYGITDSQLSLWGTGAPLREFLWSEDMAEACLFVMENIDFKKVDSDVEKEIRNCHINIGTGKEISIKQLSEIVSNLIGYQGEILFDHSKPDGTMRKITDPTKIHQLGWRHKIDVQQGISSLYEWYLNSLL